MLAKVTAFGTLIVVMMQPMVMLGLGDLRIRALLLCMGTAVLFGLGLRELRTLRGAPSGAPDDV